MRVYIDVLDTEYPLEHFLLGLEYVLIDAVGSHCVETFPQFSVLILLHTLEIPQLLL